VPGNRGTWRCGPGKNRRHKDRKINGERGNGQHRNENTIPNVRCRRSHLRKDKAAASESIPRVPAQTRQIKEWRPPSLPRLKLREDDHNNLQLGLGLAVSDHSPSIRSDLPGSDGLGGPDAAINYFLS